MVSDGPVRENPSVSIVEAAGSPGAGKGGNEVRLGIDLGTYNSAAASCCPIPMGWGSKRFHPSGESERRKPFWQAVPIVCEVRFEWGG